MKRRNQRRRSLAYHRAYLATEREYRETRWKLDGWVLAARAVDAARKIGIAIV